MKKIVVVIAGLILVGCSSNSRYGFWEVSRFKLTPGAIENQSEIRILYAYMGPSHLPPKDKEYYNHCVAISVSTGDTINILTLVQPTEDYDKEKVYNYFDTNEIITKMGDTDSDQLPSIKNWDSVKVQPRSKVYRDKKFDDIANNQFPTVIGTIGTLSRSR